jgi:phosphoglucomutase
MEANKLLEQARTGFLEIGIDQKYKDSALTFIEQWLTDPQFADYKPQLIHLIENKDWDYLLDCFYQIIPFGTGGRRGEVGIGPNRINKWTIQSSAQGHSQYLKKMYPDEAGKRGIVLSFGVREFITNKHFNDGIDNPVKNLKGVDLANAAAEVYSANGVKCFIFDGPRTTPELSFAIRYLKACAGDMFDASHNPPEHNGKKVYDEYGGQLVPPEDETLVTEVTKNVTEIRKMPYAEAEKAGLIEIIGAKVDEAFIEEIAKLSLSPARNLNIVYTPLHGVGSTSVHKVLEKLGFDVKPDPKTNYFSGKFENVTFNIPNPEVVQSFDTTLKYAEEVNADIILNSDPDADRIGVMVKDNGAWEYLNGNEIGAILTEYVTQKKKGKVKKGVVVKTTVTTNLAARIAEMNNLEIIGELPVGFKYIGQVMNQLEKEGRIDDFYLGIEESNGYIAGNYLRDKDASIAGLWLAELGAELKDEGKTILDYLKAIYSKYGFYRNYLTEIRLPGAEGMSQIQQIQKTLRGDKPQKFGRFEIKTVEDFLDRTPLVSETDRSSKDLLVYHMTPPEGYISMRVTVRPSGTEPKSKMYFEIGTEPFASEEYEKIKKVTEDLLKEFEKDVLKFCYKAIGIDFPDRGFLIFWQVPMRDKIKYFEIEPKIEALKDAPQEGRAEELKKLLEFLGADPVQKVDAAFKAKNNIGIKEYLSLQ